MIRPRPAQVQFGSSATSENSAPLGKGAGTRRDVQLVGASVLQLEEATAVTQDEIVRFLTDPRSYGYADVPVVRMDTHISIVFLVGDQVYKMKRALRLPYLDYSTLEKRRHCCRAEVDLNHRTAPMLYRDIVPVTQETDGTLRLGGCGEPVEWLVEMARFDQADLFDRMVVADQMTPALLTRLADEIARFHADAEPVSDRSGGDAMRLIAEGNARELAAMASGIFDPGQVAALADRTERSLEAARPLLEERGRSGFVRRCHGDLHLRNICLYGGRPILFDGIEFNDRFSNIDTLYDLAFLLMDLEHRGHRDFANLVFNRYLAISGEREGLAALPLFLSCRATVRAKTSATAAGMAESGAADGLIEEARAYLDLAQRCLEPGAPVFVAVGGLSGSGKSTLAQGLAPIIGRVPGAVTLRSDVLRKRLFGVAPETALDAQAYTSEMSQKVYRRLQDDAASLLAAGQSVIVDAVFARGEERAAIEAVTRNAGVPATFIWLDAPSGTLQSRAEARTCDASDADAAVVRQQLSYETGFIGWHRIETGGDTESTLRAAQTLVAG